MGFFSDADAGRFHPSTPELRLKDQDADGIEAEVIYGILGCLRGFPMQREVCRAPRR